MKLGDMLDFIDRAEAHIAVYEELIHYLDGVLEDGEEIPMRSGTGSVPSELVGEVKAKLRHRIGELEGALADIEDAEVEDVNLGDL